VATAAGAVDGPAYHRDLIPGTSPGHEPPATAPLDAAPLDAVPLRVGLERGRTWVFATAVDWPGWCRRGRSDDAAIATLLDYRPRYALAVGGPLPSGDEATVVGTVAGNATTDFGAPGVPGPWDHEPLDDGTAGRLVTLLERGWSRFDTVIATAPPELRRGPRGGGRERDAVASHVREAERAYGRAVGVRVPPRTPWPDQRAAIAAGLRAGAPGARWPVRYGIARCAWHVLDHVWEIEDRTL
jgi:hypothetical protein